MKQLVALAVPKVRIQEEEKSLEKVKPFFQFKRKGKEIFSLHKGLTKSLIRQIDGEDELERLAIEAMAEKTFQKSELRRNLTYLSNRLVFELNKGLKDGNIDNMKLRTILRNNFTYLSILQELMGFNKRIEATPPELLSPTKTEKRLPKRGKKKMSVGKNPDDDIKIRQAEALEAIGLVRPSDSLSLNFNSRTSKLKPSERFAFEQLIYSQIQCFLDISLYAES